VIDAEQETIAKPCCLGATIRNVAKLIRAELVNKGGNMNQRELENRLERVVDDFSDWKKIYGETVPAWHEEPKDRQEARQKFTEQIARLRKQIAELV